MADNVKFKIIDARHVVSDEGFHVDYINAHQLKYGTNERNITLDAERFIASDGAPDGRVITLKPGLVWNDGSILTDQEVAAIRDDLVAASVPLRSKMRFDAS